MEYFLTISFDKKGGVATCYLDDDFSVVGITASCLNDFNFFEFKNNDCIADCLGVFIEKPSIDFKFEKFFVYKEIVKGLGFLFVEIVEHQDVSWLQKKAERIIKDNNKRMFSSIKLNQSVYKPIYLIDFFKKNIINREKVLEKMNEVLFKKMFLRAKKGK